MQSTTTTSSSPLRAGVAAVAAVAALWAPATAATASAARPAAPVCPAARLAALPADGVALAARAAFAADPPANRPLLTLAALAPSDPGRGDEVHRRCGVAWSRVVVVHLTDRALLPSASLSERVVWVGLVGGRWSVFHRAH